MKWELDKSVNILAGKNGSYKSTLLRIITKMLDLEKMRQEYTVRNAHLETFSSEHIKYQLFKDTLLHLQEAKDDNGMLSKLHSEIASDIEGMSKEVLSERELAADLFSWSADYENKMTTSEFKELINYRYISTFDSPDEKSSHESGMTYLESLLKELSEQYAHYVANMYKQAFLNAVSDSSNPKEESQYAKSIKIIDTFTSIIDKAFQSTRKTINSDDTKLSFAFSNSSDVVEMEQLSAGEKQYLIIMLTVLLSEEKEMILIMDEPEISLHFEWQKTLIDDIRSLNPNCQIIIATHSPAVIMDGWQERVTNMEEITEVEPVL